MDYPATRIMTGYDATLYPPSMKAGGNCTLTVYLRVHLVPVNPANGAAAGTQADYGGTQRRIIRWSEGVFKGWSERYERECQAFWDERFWLRPPDTYAGLDYPSAGGGRMRPNVRCLFFLSLSQTASAAHHTIKEVRLADNEPYFQSDSETHDHRDFEYDNMGDGLKQRGHLHEMGHLLGLRHSGEGKPGCVNHSDECYAGPNIMGSGEEIDATNAQPWQKAMGAITDLDWKRWAVSLKESESRPRKLS